MTEKPEGSGAFLISPGEGVEPEAHQGSATKHPREMTGSDVGLRVHPGTVLVVSRTKIHLALFTRSETVSVGLPVLRTLFSLSRNPWERHGEVIEHCCVATGLGPARQAGLIDDFIAWGVVEVAAPRPAGGSWVETPPVGTRTESAVPSSDAHYVLSGDFCAVIDHGFVVCDFGGAAVAALSPTDLWVARHFGTRSTPADARQAGARFGLTAAEVDAAIDRLHAVSLLAPAGQAGASLPLNPARKLEKEKEAHEKLLRATEQRWQVHLAGRDDRLASGTVPVVAVNTRKVPPLALGLLVAYARAHASEAAKRRFAFTSPWLLTQERLGDMARAEASIFMFSNYFWESEKNLSFSAHVKAMNPASITVHGGPDTPKYRGDVERYFADHPHVDVAIHGEGEATFTELLERFSSAPFTEPPDLSALADVPGLTFRHGDSIVTTAPRDRMSDIDAIPSPYLTGEFDDFAGGGRLVILETNRGCPYGCTFCDWGSATLSRLRRFDEERVKGEFHWCAKAGFETWYVSDSNFGILDRDIEFARYAGGLHRQLSYPKNFAVSYAKNRADNLREIVEVFAADGVVSQGNLSVQSFDANVLEAVKRKNIKLEKYHELAADFQNVDLPLYSDLMIGLPGSTLASTAADVQTTIDREIPATLNRTTLLVNSPMNAPEYRAAHGIESKPGEFLDHTATYSKEDMVEIMALRQAYYVFERIGLGRLLARFVRHEIGMAETTFLTRLHEIVRSRPHAYPTMTIAYNAFLHTTQPPGSWRFYQEDMRRFLTEEIGLPSDSALTAVLEAQCAVLRDDRRPLPATYELPNDIVSWHRDILAAKRAGHSDWPKHVRRLRERPSGALEVRAHALDSRDDFQGQDLLQYELDSPLARPSARAAL